MQEVDLEELLSAHPYLIDPNLKGLIPSHQKSKSGCRYDLGFETSDGLSLVELKKVELRAPDIKQLIRYCRVWGRSKVHPLAKTHYLIGKRPSDFSSLEQAVNQSPIEIRLRFIGSDIPWYLAMVGRQYREYTGGYAKNVVHINL